MRRDRLEKADRGQLMSLAYQLMMGLVMGQRASGDVPAEQMADLHFRDLMTDPVGSVERAYGHLGLPFADEMRSTIPEYLASKPKDKFGPHVYDPKVLGLNEGEIRNDFQDYIVNYGIELED